MLQVLGLLLAIAGILLLSWYLTRKLGTVYGYQKMRSENLEILDRLSLGQNESLVIARVGKSFLLLSASPQGISCLKELHEEDLSGLERQGEKPSEPGVAFRELLEQWKKRK